jgi:hypothetical protein
VQDCEPSKTADMATALESLFVPGWVPIAVAAVAQIHLTSTRGAEDEWILDKLTSHSSMKRIWDTLLIRVKGSDPQRKFFYPTVLNSQDLVARFASALRYYDGDLQELYFERFPAAALFILILMISMRTVGCVQTLSKRGPQACYFECRRLQVGPN